jgi:hypothetical protein
MTMPVTVEAYFASLPGGLDAYPECAHKGETLGLWLRRSPTRGLAERLPAHLGALLAEGATLPTWVPEVHATALYLAIREVHFADDAAFLAHAYACNRAVLDTPTNRVLFWVAAPRAILRAAGLRWNSLHRGSTLDIRIRSDTSAQVAMTFPAHLFPEVVLRGSATGFVAALENAGAHEVQMVLKDAGPTRAVFAGSWK